MTTDALSVFVSGQLLGFLRASHDVGGIHVIVLEVPRAEFVEDQDADLVTGNLVVFQTLF